MNTILSKLITLAPSALLGYFLSFLTLKEQNILILSIGKENGTYLMKTRNNHTTCISLTLNFNNLINELITNKVHEREEMWKEYVRKKFSLLPFIRNSPEVNIIYDGIIHLVSSTKEEELKFIHCTGNYKLFEYLGCLFSRIKSICLPIHFGNFISGNMLNLSFPYLKKLKLPWFNAHTYSKKIPLKELSLSHLEMDSINYVDLLEWDVLPYKELKILQLITDFSLSYSFSELKTYLEELKGFPKLEYIHQLKLFETIYSYTNNSAKQIVELIELLFSKLPKLKYLQETSSLFYKDVELWYWLANFGNRKECSFYNELEYLTVNLDLEKYEYLWCGGNGTSTLENRNLSTIQNVQNPFVNLFPNLQTFTIYFISQDRGLKKHQKELSSQDHYEIIFIFVSQMLKAQPHLHLYLPEFPYSPPAFFLKRFQKQFHSQLHFNKISPEFENYIHTSNINLLQQRTKEEEEEN